MIRAQAALLVCVILIPAAADPAMNVSTPRLGKERSRVT
jgi:hypothetical protein